MSNAAIQSGQKLVEHFEGCHETLGYGTFGPYICPAGAWTIGWGSTKDQNGQYVTRWTPPHNQEQCDHLLTDSLEGGCTILESTIPYWDEMHHDMQGALISFGYNLGYHFYNGENFDTITRELKNKNWPAVPDALMLYVNPGTPYEAGLTKRRKAEGELWINGLDKLETPPPPERPMTTTFDDFLNTYKHWNNEKHQIDAADIAYQSLAAVDRIEEYFDIYRTPAEPPAPNNPLSPFTFFDQKDNGPEGERECQSTAIAMCLKYLQDQLGYSYSIKINDDKDYLNVVYSIHGGDTTNQNTHIKALEKIGAPGRFITNASAETVKAEIDKGYPVAVGYLHHGHVSNPSGGGHYCVLRGYNANSWYSEDPFGNPDLINGGWISSGIGCGKNQSYSFQNFNPRLFVNAPNDGWIWVFS